MDLHFERMEQMNVYNYLVSLSVHDFLHLERKYFPFLDLSIEIMKSSFFWDVVPCHWVNSVRRSATV